MNLLITGVTGFIGGALAREAVAQGHKVLALTRGMGGARTDAMEWVQGTLADPPLLKIERFAPDACIHSAWITTPGIYLESEVNETLRQESVHFVRALMKVGIPHFTVLGTCIEYAMTGTSLREEDPLEPLSVYAKSKNALHLELVQMDANLAWARIFYPYGIGEDQGRLCSSLIRSFRKGEVLRLKTPRSTKDYIHVRDIASALLTVVTSKYKGAINIGTGAGIAIEDLARVLAGLLNCGELVQCEPNPPVDPYGSVIANADRLKALGWSPQVSLDAGLIELIHSLS